MKNILILLLLIINIVGCNNKYEVVDASSNDAAMYTIDVPLDEIEKEDLLDNVNYIFLDEKFLIGSVSRILFFNNKILIHDKIGERIVAFDMAGGYLFHINNKGKGPLEYLKISDFTIDKLNNEIIIYDDRSHKIIRYSIDKDKYIKEIKVEFYPTAIAWNDNSIYFYNPYTFNYPRKKELHYSLIKTNEKGNIKKKYFTVDDKMGNFMSNSNPLGFSYGKYLTFHNRFENIIYSIENNTVFINCRIQFQNNEKYQEAILDAISKGTRNTDLFNICSTDLSNFCESNDLITFTYWRNNTRYSVVFSKKANKIIYHKSNPAIFSEYYFSKNIPLFVFPTNIYNNSFVSIIPASLFEVLRNDAKYNSLINRWMTESKVISKFKNLNINSNPVIAIYDINNE